MSFGFSVGDFLAVGKLVTEIISSLKDSGGSRTDYRDIFRELECLRAALVHLDKLTGTGTSQDLTAIKYAALSCRRPLEEFLGRIRKYDRSLGIQSRGSSIKVVIDKIRFPIAHKDDVQRLQAYLSVHVSTVNMLLAEHGLETMQLAAERIEAGHLQSNKWFENAGDLLGRLRRSVVFQTDMISKSMAILENVHRFLSGELKASLRSFETAVARVCVSTQQIYAVVLEIQTSIASTPDIRWTFLQDPIIVEDALGRKFPVPSEYDYSLLDTIIKHKFQDGPGAVHVAVGNYEIMDAKNRLHVLSVNSRLKPGCSITMAILVSQSHSTVLTDEYCPMPRCQSTSTIAVPGGGRRCCNCDVWFDQSKKRPSSLANLWAAYEMLSTADQSNVDADREKISGQKRKRSHDDDFSIVPFKNVKLANCEAHDDLGDFESSSNDDDDVRNEDIVLEENKPIEFDDAIRYVNKIKVRHNRAPICRLIYLLTWPRVSFEVRQKSINNFSESYKPTNKKMDLSRTSTWKS
ncbi:hypothetical protein F4818DRAFT_142464 [Hypoxylon cercidicola]|nr:hypothetical protein F4818DRAFT_142464 [Hypoxylon cercidicola]